MAIVYCNCVNLYSGTSVNNEDCCLKNNFLFLLFVLCIMSNFVKFNVENICNLQKLYIL